MSVSSIRVGSGWDVHKLVSGRLLILGGVTIPSDKGCLGHSDGDALIHAVIDALLGAMGQPDIGTLFPDTESKYKDISSVELLKETGNIVTTRGYKIINIDTTIILQTPKLFQYKSQMAKNIAEVLELHPNCVNVKAKTAESMFCELGTGDAVVAEVVVLIEKVGV